jgi:CheY-like chemotaxis protein
MLGVIQGFTELAMMKIAQNHPVRPYLEEIDSAAQRSIGITRQLLAFARQQTIAPKILDLNDTIAGMLKILRRLVGEEIDLVWKPGNDLWPVKMDPSQVDQLLANLIVNARDAIERSGEIGIETRNEEVTPERCQGHPGLTPGRYVALAVRDTGSGMDPATLARAFEPFFTTKELGKGTGLGLSTVYGIVKQNGGFIDVVSSPGRGTTFTLFLPRRDPDSAGSSVERPSVETPMGSETVLLVEDEKPLLKFATILLEELGYAVLSADGPQVALRLAEGHSGDIDLMLTDVVMPRLNGYELWEQLKIRRPGLKCLFMSGYSTDVIADSGVLHDGVHFIHKPFSREVLARKMREVLSP